MSSRGDGSPVDASRFYLFAGLVTLVLLAVVRMRVQFGSALPSATPVRWHLLGLAQDFVVVTLGILISSALALLTRSSRVGTLLFAAASAFLILLALVHSEVIIMFGGNLAAGDLTGGGVAGTVGSALSPANGLLLLATLVAASAGLYLAARGSSGSSKIPPSRVWRTAVLLAIVSALLWWRLSGVHRAESAVNPIVALAELGRDYSATRHAGVAVARRPSLPITTVRELLGPPGDREFMSDEFPLAYRRKLDRPAEKWNVVILALEGLRTAEVGAYGGRGNLTPNIDRLAREGVRVDRAYSAGTRTPMGELALWYGLLPVPGSMLLSDRPTTPTTGLPEILRDHGWSSFLWISSTDQTFYRRDRFYTPRGFQMFDGNSFPDSDPRVNWGVSDRALMQRAAAAMDRLPEPFGAMVLTVNNHHPYQVPSDAKTRLDSLPQRRFGWSRLPGTNQMVGDHGVQMNETIHYTDEAVGFFFELAKDRDWFERTIFVVTGDHGIAVAPVNEKVATEHRLGELRHLVPLIFFSPQLTGGRTLDGPASQVDVMPTLLGLLGIEAGSGLGTDLFGPVAQSQQRPVFGWSEPDRVLTIALGDLVYRCVVDPRSDEGFVAGSEWVTDTRADPEGTSNLAESRPGDLARFRRWARVYATVYPWVLESGRSGMPPGRTAVVPE